MDSTGTDGSSEAPAPARAPERIVVCGLGDVGRRTAELLKGFGAHVVGVDIAAETAGAGEAFDEIVAGDCAGTEILRRAGAESARAILLVTADERSNIAAAFAARSLNPGVRLVIRSAQAQLNRLLADQLGNLVAFEPSEFSAPAFAVAALDDETKARFDLDGSTVRVISRKVRRGDWGDGRRPSELNTLHSRVIAHVSAGEILGDL
ncbi:potassium channel family protein, partial [Rhodoblastus sp.]|uniref:potassium channel family protein n=1 Tax=Rhodoblastus sp. TaxID=1962975 RepID=UPI003F94BF24